MNSLNLIPNDQASRVPVGQALRFATAPPCVGGVAMAHAVRMRSEVGIAFQHATRAPGQLRQPRQLSA